MHGVTHTIQQIRDRGVPGYEVEVIGTDADVDRRLSAVAEIDIPFYQGLKIGVPTLPAIVEALSEGRYDLIHLCTPGPGRNRRLAAGAGAASCRVLGSYHTELAAYAGLRSGHRSARGDRVDRAAASSTAPATWCSRRARRPTQRLAQLGDRRRADRALGPGRRPRALRPGAARRRRCSPGEVNVLYAGRLTREKGVDLLADAFVAARRQDPRLHLVLAGGGPEEQCLRERLGEHATFLGWLDGDDLARAYASADAFLFASQTDTFGQVMLEAQASGLPVVAVAEGGPASLIIDGETGLLAPADADALADRLLGARTFAAARASAFARPRWRSSARGPGRRRSSVSRRGTARRCCARRRPTPRATPLDRGRSSRPPGARPGCCRPRGRSRRRCCRSLTGL